MNQLILVGRLVSDPELTTLENGMKVSTINLAVKRAFKSGESNQYETDFFKCTLWSGIAEATVSYCRKGYTVGVKARIQQKYFVQNEKNVFSYPEIIVEKITFISKSQSEEE
ncbi:MAG: single-stranded DNA-binding protein [Candidatus Izemoplasmatales bacterium]|nr:single-stranded DNA-binding protein [Candidatus Izemoplasmatales bacterium]MDD4070614.1 single-stranded DNA-binding protein [Candidatus Izemoplasmatales bacterium]MDY0139302.1 single-stranded DNA-binding protein [Candidatus Izemoplasmatales bacterium]